MSMPTESVEALHVITSNLKAEHERRHKWLEEFDAAGMPCPLDATFQLEVTRAEAERIFAERVASHEARLSEQGWKRTIRVVDSPNPV